MIAGTTERCEWWFDGGCVISVGSPECCSPAAAGSAEPFVEFSLIQRTCEAPREIRTVC